MRVEPDDELYRVDNVWLGPRDWPDWIPTPPRMRYLAMGIGVVAVFVALIVREQLTVGDGLWSYAVAIAAGVLATKAVGRKITHERPAGAVLTMMWADITAPRRRGSVADLATVPQRVRRFHRHRRERDQLAAADEEPEPPPQRLYRRRSLLDRIRGRGRPGSNEGLLPHTPKENHE